LGYDMDVFSNNDHIEYLRFIGSVSWINHRNIAKKTLFVKLLVSLCNNLGGCIRYGVLKTPFS